MTYLAVSIPDGDANAVYEYDGFDRPICITYPDGTNGEV
jgi:YD repeat-containing protein